MVPFLVAMIALYALCACRQISSSVQKQHNKTKLYSKKKFLFEFQLIRSNMSYYCLCHYVFLIHMQLTCLQRLENYRRKGKSNEACFQLNCSYFDTHSAHINFSRCNLCSDGNIEQIKYRLKNENPSPVQIQLDSLFCSLVRYLKTH